MSYLLLFVHGVLYHTGKIIRIGAHEKATKDLPSDDQFQSSSDQTPEIVVQKAKAGGSKEPQRESEQGNCS